MRTVNCTASALIIRTRPRQEAATDTGLRIIRDQKALAYGESFDREWLWVAAPAGEGWASARFLENAPIALVTEWPRRPHGLVELREVFGEHGNPLCSGGRVNLPSALPFWDGVQRRVFACHVRVAPIFQSFFDEIHKRNLWSLLQSFDGCYNVRRKVGTTGKWSTHSWGVAIDINARTNGFGRVPQLDRRIVEIGKDHQLIWGGDWSTPDGMHFQYVSGY